MSTYTYNYTSDSYPYTYDSYNNTSEHYANTSSQYIYAMPNAYGFNEPNIYNPLNLNKDTLKNPYNLELYPKEYINIIKAGLKWDDGNWSSCDELSLKKKLMYCYVRKEAHWDLAVNFNNYAKYLEVPKIILSSVLSTSLFVNATDTTHFSNTMQFINAGIGTSLAILVGIDSYAKLSQLHSRHKNTSLEYGKLSAKIERLLQAKPDERQSFSIVLSKLDEKYSKIKEEAPFISQDKIKEFIDLFNNSNSCYDYVNSKIKTKIKFEDDEDYSEETQPQEPDENQNKPEQPQQNQYYYTTQNIPNNQYYHIPKTQPFNYSTPNDIFTTDSPQFTEIPLRSPPKPNKPSQKQESVENTIEEYHDCDESLNIV